MKEKLGIVPCTPIAPVRRKGTRGKLRGPTEEFIQAER